MKLDDLEKIFSRALGIHSDEERHAYVRDACGEDSELRAQVERILQAHEEAGAFLPNEPRDLVGTPTLNLAPGDVIDRYKLLEKLGEGGFGAVWAAEQKKPVKRRVALKIIKLGMDTKQVVARFEAERQALAMMDHPNIAKVLEAGATDTGRPYFVMELVRGIPITDYCEREKLNTEDRLDLFIKVCHAVQHAHQKGIIHRDLKPSNIMVVSHDGVPVPKVIDFGIAKAIHQELTEKTIYTKFQEFIGTPSYMSPEQAQLSGLDIDTRTDVYSLGVLLYQLLTGRTPFDSKELLAAGFDEMRKIIREKEPIKPSTRISQILTTLDNLDNLATRHSPLATDLDWIVMKCLAKERTRRYDTATGLAMDLVRHLNHEPIVARPPSRVYRLQKSWQRNKFIFTAGAAVALALVAGIAVSTWQAKVAQTERMKAKENETLADTARIKAEKALQLADEEAYAAHMLSAQAAWDNNDVAHLRRILAETADHSQRGFEWYYWQRLAHRESKTLRAHPQYVSAVDFSPDGRRFVTAGTNTAIVWDAATAEEEARFKIHDHVIWSAVFSPDSRLIATGSGDQTAKVWEAASGTVIHAFKEYDGGVRSAFSRDGTWIVTGSSENNTTMIWDVRTGELLSSLKGEPVEALAISPDGERTVTGNRASGTAKVWDVRSGALVATLAGDGGISSIAFSPDGESIVTADWAGTAKVWNTKGDKEPRTFKGHRERLWCLAISPDSRWMVTGSQDSTAKVWNLATGKELFSLKGHGEGVASVAISPDGKRIITGSRDQTAKLWDVDSDTILRTHDGGLTLSGHAKRLWDVAISPDHRWIVTGSMDHTAKVWDAATGKVLRTLEGHDAGVTSVAISPDSQWIVTVSRDASAKVWDARKVAAPITLLGHDTHIWSVAFSPDSRLIVTGSRDGIFKVWRVDTGDELFSVQGHNAPITSVTFSPDGQWIASASHDHTVKIWDTDSREEKRVLEGHQDLVWSVAFSPDSRRIVTASEDTTAKVWDVESGEERLTLTGHRVPIQSAVFSPDGQRIATGSNDGTARLWEASNARALLVLKGHPWARIRSVAFSADGQRMVTASSDKTAKTWEVATEQQATDWLETDTIGEARENVSQYTGSFQRRAEGEIAKRDRKERALDPGTIDQWLILAPVPVGDAYGSLNHKEAAEVLDMELIPQEAELSPRKGDRITVNNEVLAWIEVQLEDHLIDFNQVLGETTNDRVAYAVCYLHSETDQNGLIMTVHNEDNGKVYLNSREIHKNTAPRNYLSDPIRVPSVNLRAGRNVIVFKVVNRYHIWEGSIRLTTADGQPVDGIRLTLNPD